MRSFLDESPAFYELPIVVSSLCDIFYPSLYSFPKRLTNFHRHSSQPPLWAEAEHVDIDIGAQVILNDLRHR